MEYQSLQEQVQYYLCSASRSCSSFVRGRISISPQDFMIYRFAIFLSTSRSIPILTHPVSTWETIGLSYHFLLFVIYFPRPNKSHLTSQVLLPLCRRVEDCPGTWCCCCSPTDGASRQSDLLPSFTAKRGIFTTNNVWSAFTMFRSKLWLNLNSPPPKPAV